MHIAAYADALESFIFLEEKAGLSHTALSAASYSPIHYACNKASFEVASYILKKDPQMAKLEPHVDYQLIFLATASGDADILNLLFEYGANINSPANKRNLPVQQAIRARHVECLKILLSKGTRTDIDTKDYSPIMLAITNNQPDAVPLLLQCGENPGYVTPEKKETALTLACFTNQKEVVKLICDNLVQVDLDSNIKMPAAVHWICRSYNPEIARIVLAKNIDTNRFDNDGRVGPYYLLDVGQVDDVIDIFQQLVDHGFDINLRFTVNGKPQPGKNTILGDYITSIKKSPKIIEWLLLHGADPYETVSVPNNPRIVDFVRNSRNNVLIQLFQKYVKDFDAVKKPEANATNARYGAKRK